MQSRLIQKRDNKCNAPPSLLILGDLELENTHQERLHTLVRSFACYSGEDENEIKKLLPAYNCVFACNVKLTPFIDALAAMELVVLAETGIVHLDENLASKAGVNYTNIPGYSTEAVVQYILRCMFETLRPWHKIFSPTKHKRKEEKIGKGIEGTKVGLIGYGLIGKRLTEVLAVLGCDVYINTRQQFQCIIAKWLPLERLFAESDIVVVCCTKDAASQELITGDILKKLSADSILISISHRDVFDNVALLDTLQKRQDVTAWLDFDCRDDDEQFLALSNAHLSPHLAFYTEQTLTKRIDSCIDQLEGFLYK